MLALGASLATVGDALGYVHIVQPGETLASIAEQAYGRIQYEKLLVAANGLDLEGGSSIVPGTRLEVPALGYRRARSGDTWEQLARELLGAEHRANVLAAANDTSPWLPPEDGAEIVVPYNLRVVAQSGDTLVGIAFRFLGEREKAWVLDHYNGRDGERLERGDVVLVPLTDLPLTDAGKRAARAGAEARKSEGGGSVLEVQKQVELELPQLVADVRGGRYVTAVVRGNRFLALGPLTTEQQSTIHRQLLEAYAALDAEGLATAACVDWLKQDATARVDPIVMSPKLVQACVRGGARP